MSREDRLQKKLDKLKSRQAKIEQKINKKSKNYQERDDKEQKVWMREFVPNELEMVDFGEQTKNSKKLTKKEKKIIKKQQKNALKQEFVQFKFDQTQKSYVFDRDVEPFTERQPKEIKREIRKQQKEEIAQFKQEQKLKQHTPKEYNTFQNKVEKTPTVLAPKVEKELQKPQIDLQEKPVQKPEKIKIKPAKIKEEKNTKKIEAKINKNTVFMQTQPISEPVIKQKEVAKPQTKTEEIIKENKELKQENKELKRKNEQLNYKEKQKQIGRGFVYSEVMINRKVKAKDAEIVQLKEKNNQLTEAQKRQMREEEIRQDKVNDIMRQRRNINYALERLEDKAKYWAEISEDAYIASLAKRTYHIVRNKPAKRYARGVASLSDILMGISIGAMAQSLGYQKDVRLERERLLQKEKELQRLLQR